MLTTLFYGIYGWWKLQKIQSDGHAILGVITTCIILFLVLSGVATRSRLLREDEDQNKVLKVKKAHKVSN